MFRIYSENKKLEKNMKFKIPTFERQGLHFLCFSVHHEKFLQEAVLSL